jgi:hypothetical protein
VRTGASKAAFVQFLVGSRYTRAWHVEDDAFYAGKWHTLFDAYRATDADIVGLLYDVKSCDRFGFKASCRFPPSAQWPKGKPCFSSTQTCVRCRVSWPVLRVSRWLANATLAVLHAGGKGHHEALLGAVCASHPTLCARTSLKRTQLGAHALGGEPSFRDTSRAVGTSRCRYYFLLPGLLTKFNQTRLTLLRLYHPVKCQADPRSGRLLLDLVTREDDESVAELQKSVEREVGSRDTWMLRHGLQLSNLTDPQMHRAAHAHALYNESRLERAWRC